VVQYLYANIRLVRKGSTVANTLVYYDFGRNSFIVKLSGVTIMKHFSLSMMMQEKKLGCMNPEQFVGLL
jgi:hypothetical protein